jgi:hypothetical protein
MPSLADLTDYAPEQGVAPEADGVRRVYITGETGNSPEAVKPSLVQSITDKLLGLNGQERYQLWPEKVVREGLSAAGDALAGQTPQWKVDPVTGDVHTSPQMIEGAQAMSALAGSGGLAGTTDATLGSAPFLRPALKYKDRLYKGKEGQAHQDVIPDALYPEFQKLAMTGDDISHYNFGFHNDKGQFLSREKALEYGINTGLIDPAAGKYGALTSTLLADSSKPGTAIEAMKNQPTFYSALEHNVGKIAQDKMTGEQWLGTLANKPGVKPEELQWSGLKDYLEQNKGKPVSKADIEKHLNENKTELGEITKFDKATITKMPIEEIMALNKKGNPPAAKYETYQVPGGENYREVLMTLPTEGPAHKAWSSYTADAKVRAIDAIKKDAIASGMTEAKATSLADKFKNAQDHEIANYLGETSKLKDLYNAKFQEGGSGYKSSHWDEPNILAHMRMNDRTIDGKKSLHLEEVQSDWHQDGRKGGYKGNDDPVKVKEELQAKKKEVEKVLNGRNFRELPPEDEVVYKKLSKEFGDISTRLYASEHGVPDAPFKKNWHELALKRAIREAAENGYDRLSWTAGEHHPTNPKNLNQTGPSADAADKGMQGFYNNMLPKSVEKLTGQKVKTTNLPPKQNLSIEKDLGEGFVIMDTENRIFGKYPTQAKAQEWLDTHNPSAKVHYTDLPQSVKDTALGKGFPLYTSSHMFSPIAGNPFNENDK